MGAHDRLSPGRPGCRGRDPHAESWRMDIRWWRRERAAGNSRLEKQHGRRREEASLLSKCVSAPKLSGIGHSGGKKTQKEKLPFRSFSKVKLYMGNLFVLLEPPPFPFHAEPTDFKLLNSTLPASLGISYLE